jgi:hypothetical protein
VKFTVDEVWDELSDIKEILSLRKPNSKITALPVLHGSQVEDLEYANVTNVDVENISSQVDVLPIQVEMESREVLQEDISVDVCLFSEWRIDSASEKFSVN